jgi:endonuclease-3
MRNNESLRAERILEILKAYFPIQDKSNICRDPFKVLVRTIISQSTTEVNAERAFNNLSAKISVTPENLAQVDIKDIEDSLRIAGLHRNKSIVLKNISTIIMEKFNGELNFIYVLPLKEAREKLLSLPGVGPKTADILLLFCAGKPVLPVDTHVSRVSKRLGLVPLNEKKYDSIRTRLEEIYSPENYFAVHMLFIALGRKFCKSLKPLCGQCPLNKLCPSVGL